VHMLAFCQVNVLNEYDDDDDGQQKKGIYIGEKFSLYFAHLPRSPQWTDLHEILHGVSSRRHNHLFQILCQSVEGFRICVGSNFAILLYLAGRH